MSARNKMAGPGGHIACARSSIHSKSIEAQSRIRRQRIPDSNFRQQLTRCPMARIGASWSQIFLCGIVRSNPAFTDSVVFLEKASRRTAELDAVSVPRA